MERLPRGETSPAHRSLEGPLLQSCQSLHLQCALILLLSALDGAAPPAKLDALNEGLWSI